MLYGLQLLSILPTGDESDLIISDIPASVESFDSSDDDYVYSDDELSLQDQLDNSDVMMMNEEIEVCLQGDIHINNTCTSTSTTTNANTTQMAKKRRVSKTSRKENGNGDFAQILLSDRFGIGQSSSEESKKVNQQGHYGNGKSQVQVVRNRVWNM